jgi:hypothetical protein
MAKVIKRCPVIKALQLTAILVRGASHMTTETASHILYECMALAEFRFCHLGKHFYGTKQL